MISACSCEPAAARHRHLSGADACRLLSLLSLPIAQYQISFAPRFRHHVLSRANARWWTRTSPSDRAKVVGVAKMLTDAVSGDDGSYTPHRLIELGTNPASTRQRHKRADRAVTKLRQDVQRQGVRCRRMSSEILGVIGSLFAEEGPQSPVHHTN